MPIKFTHMNYYKKNTEQPFFHYWIFINISTISNTEYVIHNSVLHLKYLKTKYSY